MADNVDDEESLTRIELETELKRLFSQSRKNKPKNTLFFVLPDRSKETLHRFIVENSCRERQSPPTNGAATMG